MIHTVHTERVLNFIWKHFQVFLQKIILSINFFLRNELINHAGASAFFFLLSITPVFILILISVGRYLTSYPDVSDYFFVFLRTLNENLDKDLLVKIGLMKVNTTAVGILGLLSLLWAASWIVTCIQRGLGAIFPSEKIRPPVVTYIFSILILSVLLLVTVLFTFISIGLKFLQTLLGSYGVIQTLFQSLLPLLRNVFPFLAIFDDFSGVSVCTVKKTENRPQPCGGCIMFPVRYFASYAVFKVFQCGSIQCRLWRTCHFDTDAALGSFFFYPFLFLCGIHFCI